MKLATEIYSNQTIKWPEKGRHILAQFDENTVVVYQVYSPEIGKFAISNGYFGGAFKLTRMSWIKTNFLWMMYRSGWGTKTGQEIILAVRIKRTAFNEILAAAVHSKYIPTLYPNQEEWKQALNKSSVRLQWDPDHNPTGAKLKRQAIQLGLRGQVLQNYSQDWIVEIEDISKFVQQQRQNQEPLQWDILTTPKESVYPIQNSEMIKKLELSVPD